MSSSFYKVSLTAFLLALVVIVLGSYVRLSDAGLGCPDWPGCYGQVFAPDDVEEITRANLAYPDLKVESDKAWKEMIHRYFASTLGLLIIGMAYLGWKNRKAQGQQYYLPLLLVALVIFQGLLGMWTVTLLLKPSIVTLHLLTGLLTLSLLGWVVLKHKRPLENIMQPDRPIPEFIATWARLAVFVLAIQIFLGGWTSTNYVALYCPDFPTCQGEWWPTTNFSEAFVFFRETGINYEGGVLSNSAGVTVHLMHRVGALVTFLVIGGLVLSILRYTGNQVVKNVSYFVLFFLLLQVSLGIANVLLHLPVPVAVSHNAGAALLLMSLLVLNYTINTSRSRLASKMI